MKIRFIIVLYKTPEKEVRRLRLEVRSLKFKDYKIYFVDNTKDNKGYAAAINEGIRQGLIANCELFIVANPDISLKNLKARDVLEAGKYFDIWGFAMRMHAKTYYGGELDKLRLSGGLPEKKPKKRFIERDFVSGSLMCIKKEIIEKIGSFDESYFMYYEDLDYCTRARKEGFRIGIDSNTFYEHYEDSIKNPRKEYYLSSARQKFFNKYSNFWQKIYDLISHSDLFGIIVTIKQRFWSRPPTLRRGPPQNDKRSSNFIFNFASLNVSSLINKLFNFILFIFLIRYLDTNEYGIYALVWAQVSLFSPIVDLGTTAYGIVHLPTEKKAKFISIFNLRLVIAIFIFFLTVLFAYIIFRNNYRVIQYIFLTSFVIFSNMLSGSYLIKNAIEERLYHSSIISSLFNLFLILALIVSLQTFRSLPVVFILVFFFYNLYSLLNYFLVRKGFKQFVFKVDITSWKNFIKKSYVFILISFFAGLYFKIDIFLLQILKGEKEVGIYSAGYKFFEGMLFIAASYNITRTPIFAKLATKNSRLLVKAIKKDALLLSFLGMAIALLTFWFSPQILPFFIKGDYFSSIEVVRIVIFALPFILVSSIFLNAMYVLKKAYIVIIIFLFQVFLNFILNIFFIPQFSYLASSYITVLSEFVNLALLSFIFFVILRKINISKN